MDNLSQAERSKVMARVKSKATKPELVVRKFLFKNGLRYRLNDSRLPGKPDIVLPKYKIVIFVNGCFWHGHSAKKCKLARMPKSNIEFWKSKIERNRQRDKRNQQKLRRMGWRVLNVWECGLKSNALSVLLSKIRRKAPILNDVDK